MDVSDAVDLLFSGATPERLAELQADWGDHPDRVRLVGAPRFLLQQMYGVVQVNEIALKQIWLVGYAAWRAVSSYSERLTHAAYSGVNFDPVRWHQIPAQRDLDTRFDALLDKVSELGKTDPADSFQWPDDIPYPEEGLRITDVEQKGTFDLVCIAGSYVFAHEIRHGLLERDNKQPVSIFDEELECDQWALDLIIGRVSDYSHSSGYDECLVTSKRLLGIVVAQLTILTITPRHLWDASADHPPVQDRFRNVLDATPESVPGWYWLTVASMLTAFSRRHGLLGETFVCPADFKDLSYILCSKLRS